MIATSNLKNVCNLLLIQSFASLRTSLQHCDIILMKIWRKTSLNILNHTENEGKQFVNKKTIFEMCV